MIQSAAFKNNTEEFVKRVTREKKVINTTVLWKGYGLVIQLTLIDHFGKDN